MKAVKLFQNIGLIAFGGLIFALGASAQEAAPTPPVGNVASVKKDADKTEKPVAPMTETAPKPSETPQTGKQTVASNKTDDKTTARTETMSEEEAAVIPYYNNYMSAYRLGPQDVISIEVFGQCPEHCKPAITVPPTAKISYPFIKGGVMVGGKTVDEVAEEIKKQLNEIIIDPEVIVTLEKVGSARYSVLGDVATPGVKMMERRLSVYEAIVESGGILSTGDKKRVTIVRQTQNGLTPIVVNLDLIARGKAEMVYLVPGDQVVVPGNRIKTVKTVLDAIGKISVFKLLFGGF